jgi:hypothetical protein
MCILGEKAKVTVSANQVSVVVGSVAGAGGKRGKVTGFSYQARARMLNLLNSIVFERVSFVTLTYRYNQESAKRAYGDLRAWHKGLIYGCGGFGVIWKAERQDRGAIHYHCFCVDMPKEVGRERLVDGWMSVTGQDGDTAARLYGVDMVDYGELGTKGAGVVVAYMAKYANKEKSSLEGKSWGVMGRKYLDERVTVYETDYEGAAGLVGEMLANGGKAYEPIKGCKVYKLYLKSIGTDNRNCVVGRFGDRIGKIDFGPQNERQLEFTV